MENNNNDSGFIKETVKNKSKKKIFLTRLIAAVIIAAAAAFSAAFVFAFTLPVAKKAAGVNDGSDSKISISMGSDGTAENDQSDDISNSNSQDENGEQTNEADTDIESEVTSTSSSSEPVQTPPVEEKTYVEKYRELHQELNEISEPVEKSIVQVTGITSLTDYFNQAYENEQKTSGIIIGENQENLFVLTDYAILSNVERIQVEFYGGEYVDAVYQSHDADTGMAIIKIDVNDISQETSNSIAIAELGNSYNVRRGDPIIALGSPMGYYDYMAYGTITSTSNIVSAYDERYPVFTTSISGSTGGNGIIINLDGEIVGIIISGTSSLSDHTINAYSVSYMKKMFEQLLNNEKRPFIGVKGADVTSEIAEKTGIPKGMIITGVKEDSPAMVAGLNDNDVIIKIGDDTVMSAAGYAALLKEYKAGDKVDIIAMRKGAEGYAEVEFNIVVGEK